MCAASSNIRNFWQSHTAEHQSDKKRTKPSVPEKAYGFPRWRSTDALSASLVASNNVEIPPDSTVPEERLQKMRETERIAQIDKAYMHQQVEPSRRLHKGKSLDSLTIQLNVHPWYDRRKIRQSISKESIANIAKTRERFETQGEVEPSRGLKISDACSRTTELLKKHSFDGMIPRRASSHSVKPKLQKDGIFFDDNENRSHIVSSKGFHDEPKYTLEGITDHSYSEEEQLFMLYMRQNPEIISNLGITYCSSTAQAMEELQGRRVELRFLDDKISRPRLEKRVSSLIKSEIRELQEREDELLESRKELGLPTLQLPSDALRAPNVECFGSTNAFNEFC
ncbi:unnamed protein product [Angiostrongylus costaricensis]|uniref:Enkurin domain-containing protein n=1 Tax=Angiostrongylus costaricensis TaxID=334426 RepID=A0A158PHM4_ANGCS|nr:unnamed protein product [Angiostrongylus costaricensis]